jgi:hypothetical protein
VRLDHLLSKEHHERHPEWWGVGREGVVRCSGGDRVHNNKVLGLRGKAAGTLLGPEATPAGCCRPAWWWGVVFDLWIVVASIE